MFKCTFCEYEYSGKVASTMILHKCSDEEWHYIDRIDLKEKPLPEIGNVRVKREPNVFSLMRRRKNEDLEDVL